MDGATLTATMVPLTTGIGAFTGLLPDLKEVRRAHPTNDTMKHDLRVGEVTASLAVLTLGVVASYFTKSTAPFIAAAVVCLVLICMYESVRMVNPVERKMA